MRGYGRGRSRRSLKPPLEHPDLSLSSQNKLVDIPDLRALGLDRQPRSPAERTWTAPTLRGDNCHLWLISLNRSDLGGEFCRRGEGIKPHQGIETSSQAVQEVGDWPGFCQAVQM